MVFWACANDKWLAIESKYVYLIHAKCCSGKSILPCYDFCTPPIFPSLQSEHPKSHICWDHAPLPERSVAPYCWQKNKPCKHLNMFNRWPLTWPLPTCLAPSNFFLLPFGTHNTGFVEVLLNTVLFLSPLSSLTLLDLPGMTSLFPIPSPPLPFS